jgi:NADPH-dependent glutamate synthase beta subunit-like oxidoreductase
MGRFGELSVYRPRRKLLSIENPEKYLVAVIGAGPAGLYASKQLAIQGVRVELFNATSNPAD